MHSLKYFGYSVRGVGSVPSLVSSQQISCWYQELEDKDIVYLAGGGEDNGFSERAHGIEHISDSGLFRNVNIDLPVPVEIPPRNLMEHLTCLSLFSPLKRSKLLCELGFWGCFCC